jgi:type I restriction enzyme S subunit
MGETILKTDLVDEGIPVYSATMEDHYFGYLAKPNVILDEGDFVIPARGNSIGYVKQVKETSTCTQTTIYSKYVRPKGVLFPRFVYFYLVGLKKALFSFTQTAIPQITVKEVSENPILIPSYEEQEKIANFLDKKTAQIDDLIENKKKMIALLKEKRSAIINQAVTKGLDPKVKTKPSGIDWIGDVPEGWVKKKVKFISEINSDALSENTQEDYEFYYIDIGNVTLENGYSKEDKIIFGEAPSRARRVANFGDTIVSTVRTYLKAIAFIDERSDDLIVSTGFAVISPRNEIDNKYLYYSFCSERVVQTISAISVGVSYPATNASDIADIFIVFPSIHEQKKIVAYLEKKTKEINRLIARIKGAINQLYEYREAIITSAVTGKIDVREEAL